MRGVYGTINRSTGDVRFTEFPFGTAACADELARLRRHDPPILPDIVSQDPILSVAPEDRLLAYHLLLRAAFVMCRRPNHAQEAIPYLMAFSVLSRIQFAGIEIIPEPRGINIKLTVLNEAEITLAQHRCMLLTANGTMH